MANNAMIRKRMDELQSQVTTEKEWWDKRKASIQTDFMKELDEEQKSATMSPTSMKSAIASPTGTSSTTKTASDDDAVIVESGGPKEQQGGGGGKKKKKAKH